MRRSHFIGIAAMALGVMCVSAGAQPAAFSVHSHAAAASAASDAVRSPEAVIADHTVRISERISAAQHLPRNLDSKRTDVFLQFLASHDTATEFNTAGLRMLKNELMTAMREQMVVPPTLTDVLLNVWRDKRQDPVVRDYALQHLACWYENPKVGVPEDRVKVRQTLFDAANQKTSAAGTALLGLHRLALATGEADQRQIDQLALQLLNATDAAEAARISAIEVCAERGITSALPRVVELARTETNTVTRVAAIAAIGQLGRAEELRFLNSLKPEPQTQAAVQSAIKRLTARITHDETL